MQEGARAVLADWSGDVAVVGLVKRPGEVLSLWFVPRSGMGTLSRGDRPYKLEDVTLGPDFHGDLRVTLTTLAFDCCGPTLGHAGAWAGPGRRTGRCHEQDRQHP